MTDALPTRSPATAAATLRTAAAALAGGFALAGCTVNRPTVQPIAVTVAATGVGVEQLSIELELVNPGADEIELVEYDYTLRGSDGSGYSGRWAALLALPPQTTTRASIPAVVPAAPAGRGWSLQGSLRYRDPKSIARILYELGVLKPEAGFAASELPVGHRKETSAQAES